MRQRSFARVASIDHLRSWSAHLTESLPRLCRHESFYDPNRRDISADNAWHGARQAREQGGLPEEDLIA